MNFEMTNIKTEHSEEETKIMNYKLKNLTTTIQEQNQHISELNYTLALAENEAIEVKNRIDGVKELIRHKTKEIQKENEVLDELQNAVWKERKDYEKYLTNKWESLQMDSANNDVKKTDNSSNNCSISKGESNFQKYFVEKSSSLINELQKCFEEYRVKKEVLLENRKNT